MMLNGLPFLKNYSNHQSQYLQLIAQFAKCGPEARKFLLRLGTLERLLNMFYGGASPYYKDWLVKQELPAILTSVPDMGLPTTVDPNVKMSGFQLMKERGRLTKMT